MSRLLEAVFANNVGKITTLLDRDPDRIKDTEAFCQAIGWGRREAVNLLVQRGADLNAKDRNGNHPLSMACHSRALDLFDELVLRGSDPRLAAGLPTDAAWSGRVDVLKHLRNLGFDMNEPNAKGIRPLDAAVGMGHLQVVEYLLSENVDTCKCQSSLMTHPGRAGKGWRLNPLRFRRRARGPSFKPWWLAQAVPASARMAVPPIGGASPGGYDTAVS